MQLLADESVDGPIVFRLRSEGHAVDYIAEMEPGITDDEVLRLAISEGKLLITADKDFGELVFRQGLIKEGIILIRLAGLPASEKAEVVAQAFSRHGERLLNAFSVFTKKTVRIRRQTIR